MSPALLQLRCAHANASLASSKKNPDVMIVSTRWLFLTLLEPLEIEAVCDIGSMNGADALAFRRKLPAATIHAFEANPHNALQMRTDAKLQRAAVAVIEKAVTNYDGSGDFFLVRADYKVPHGYRGMSSLYRRSEETMLEAVTSVPTVRLDTEFASHSPSGPWALWIDVEGKAYEVLEGATRLLESVALLHVEVETEPCITPDQKFYRSVREFLEARGFVEIATDRHPRESQFNALYVRRRLARGRWWRVRALARAAHCRALLAFVARHVLPRWLRQAIRTHFVA